MPPPNDLPPRPVPLGYISPGPRPASRRVLWGMIAGVCIVSFLLAFGAAELMSRRRAVQAAQAQAAARNAYLARAFATPAARGGTAPGASPGPQLEAQPARPVPPGQADAARCEIQLRHLAAGLQAWSNRHDWHLPDRWEDLVDAGLIEPADLTCPADLSSGSSAGPATGPSISHITYVYVGRGLTTPARPDTVVAYEPAVHFGGDALHVLFGDGSVRLLKGDDARQFLAAAASAQRPLEWPAKRDSAAARAGP